MLTFLCVYFIYMSICFFYVDIFVRVFHLYVNLLFYMLTFVYLYLIYISICFFYVDICVRVFHLYVNLFFLC